ncbi:TatD family hydrolase [Dysgonomonas sp. 511]|uniref:TatD family hydrolase n=1 Tax=Dysgonomonas sp. 511 TaxID=2302930 RepID=UPI0013D60967|nr:TatD family hydrolase [Dysgonomonas sp. 511]NDV79251.1 hypothetical protein [Dysgonomonas sp. 511]
MLYYDIHTHNTCLRGEGQDVRRILNTYPETFEAVRAQNPNSWYSCGIHPWYSGNAEEKLAQLTSILTQKKVVAVGEAGLDKLKGGDMQMQTDIFRKQIDLSIRFDKPMIIHCVKAWDELIALHKAYKSHTPWILHGYRGNAEQARQLVQFGFKFSVGEKFNADAVRHIPSDSLFCETDNSKVSICNIYSSVSDVLGVDVSVFVGLAAKNAIKMFDFS